MKKMTLCLILLTFGFQSFSQAPPGSAEYYRQKSKSQRTTGWVLLGVGTAMAVGGGIGFSKHWDLFQSNTTKADVYGAIMAAGIVADLVSIPVFISAGRNARRAARVSVSSQLLDFPQGNNSYVKPHPTISVKIPF